MYMAFTGDKWCLWHIIVEMRYTNYCPTDPIWPADVFDWLADYYSEKAMVPLSSTLAWKIPWMEEPDGLQSMGSQSVRHDWGTSLHFSLSCIGEGNGNPLQCSCLENPRDGEAWWAAVYGVSQSRTRLEQLSSSSSGSSSRLLLLCNDSIMPLVGQAVSYGFWSHHSQFY